MSLVWREQLSVGNDIIDNDHKYLIDIINLIEHSFATKNLNALAEALDSLTQYSKSHFAHEEKIAQAVGYKQIAYLNRSHSGLVKQLDKAKNELNEISQEWSSEIAAHFNQFLRDWLINHVIKEDLLMKPALQKYPPNFDSKVGD